jgi:DNA-binding transcriptional MocR family regulator
MAPSVSAHALATLLGHSWRRPGESATALAHGVRALVVDGRLAVRTRIPSERALAHELGVSRGSVSRAYDLLRNDGYLASRRGAGSWLTLPGGGAPPPPLFVPGAVEAIDLTVAALPAPDPLLADAAARAASRLAQRLHDHGYAASGLPELREAIAARYRTFGVETTVDQVMVTAGAQHALSLVLALLCSPGDRAVVDAPAYPRTLAALRAARVRAVPVPLAAAGWDVPAWSAALGGAGPRVAVTIPDFHNPTGLTMTADARQSLARACARTGTLLVADETCRELRLDGPAMPPPLCAFDPGGTVVTVGTMSKSAWGGLRIGWIRATPGLIRELTAVRADLDMASPVLDQLLALELSGEWEAVVASRRALLRERRDALLDALATSAPTWTLRRPRGGLSAWVRLPAPMATHLAAVASRDGLEITPGPSFSVDGTFEHHLRLPFTLAPDELRAAVVRLSALAEGLGAGTAAATVSATAI